MKTSRLVESALWAAVVSSVLAGLAHARPIVNKAILKTYFETGDVPTADQFANLLDSQLISFTPGYTLLGVAPIDLVPAPSPGQTVPLKRFGIGIEQPANPLGYLSPSDFTLVAEPEFAGEFGFMAVLFGDGLGLQYFGIVQMHMDAVGRGAPLGIHVEYLAYETTPGVPLTTAVIPGAPSAVLLGLAGIGAARRRRR